MRHHVDTSPALGERVSTTCYMCACRCGIHVHLQDGRIRYIEGNRAHPVNRGVLCAKGSAGIMQHYAPSRLRKPLLRTGPRGSGEFREISWDEALGLATTWLSEVRWRDPRRLAFFTGRDQSQALTGFWAAQYGTPNYAAHGGFCSVNMAAAGLYTIGGSFWEFGEPDWERARYLLLLGVAEDHDSNPIKLGLAEMKANGAKIVSVNPVRTGYSAIADEWLGITPGTDGLLVMALCHELLRAGRIDIEFLAAYTNAAHLVIRDPGGAEDGLVARDDDGRPLVYDRRHEAVLAAGPEAAPALKGTVRLSDGRSVTPAFELVAARLLEERYAPDAVAGAVGLPAATIRRIAAEIAHAAFEQEVVVEQPWTDSWGRRHERFVGRPVSLHAMRGISAHSNGFHTCRMLHVLQMLLGAIDRPGSFRYKPPFPRPTPPPPKPAGKRTAPGEGIGGMPLGFPQGPEDLLVDERGDPLRIDKAFSWEAPLAAHGMMHGVITNAWKGDPYPIDVLFMYMANMAWNSAMNVDGTIRMLTDRDESGEYRIPRIVYSDAYASEMVAYSDLVLPDTTYLERWDCISLLDRPICSADCIADSIRQPVVAPDRDVRPFQDVLIDLGARLGLPAFTKEDGSPRFPGGYPDYMVNHERKPGVGSLAGWRGVDGSKVGRGEPNPDQLQRYVEHGCFFEHELAQGQRFMRHANRDYLAFAVEAGLIDDARPVTLQLYGEVLQRFRLAAEGHGAVQPPEAHRERIRRYFDPLPLWYPPFEDEDDSAGEFRIHAVTQRPMAMYHSWGGQNAWLRQIHGSNHLYVPTVLGRELGIGDGDEVWIESRHGRVRARVRLMEGVNRHTVWTWNAIAKRRGAWGLDPEAPEATKSFLLNHLIDDLLPEREGGYRYGNSDPVTGQAAWYDLRVRLVRAKGAADDLPVLRSPPGVGNGPERLRYGAEFRRRA
jgi:sulfite dehydrogenase (quinone) subunit SoeA